MTNYLRGLIFPGLLGLLGLIVVWFIGAWCLVLVPAYLIGYANPWDSSGRRRR